MYKKVFFKYIVFFFVLFLSSATFVFSLNPSYLFLSRNTTNTSNIDMVLLITPSENFSSGSDLTISFPVDDDTEWCKTDGVSLGVEGVAHSKIDMTGWEIDYPLPGELEAKCYQGSGATSHDRIVISEIGELVENTSYAVKINANANLSTGSGGGSNNVVVQLSRGLLTDSVAYAIYLQGPGGVEISAFVNEDTFSEVTATSSTVERGIWSTVRVKVLNSQGNPIPGRQVKLNFDKPGALNLQVNQTSGVTNSSGVFQTQVRSFDTGIIKVEAVDESFSQDVEIQDTANLTIKNVPTVSLKTPPMYNVETSNKIQWDALSGNYQYFVQASLNSNFTNVQKNSGWISQNEYTFEGLDYGKAYYYRAKVKNIADAESSYSNIVSTIQAEKPSGNIEVLDPVVERGIPASVRVRVVSTEGNPMSGREVRLEIDKSGNDWKITQPSGVTDGNGYIQGKITGEVVGTVKVTAVDVTSSEDYYLPDHDWLQVTQISTPAIQSLSEYSSGLSRRIRWNALGSGYEYYVQASTTTDFANARNSGWISSNEYRFEDLTHGQGYFYRVKARNIAKKEGSYSNVVTSIQDNRNPEVELIDFEIARGEGQEMIKFTFSAKSLSGISSVSFKCGDSVSCADVSSSNSFHNVILQKEDLEPYLVAEDEYVLEYCFEAVDIVGNKKSFCEEEVFGFLEKVEDDYEEDEKEVIVSEPEPKKEENIITRAFAPIRDNVRKNVEEAVVFVQDLDVNDATVQTTSIVVVSTVTPITIFSVIFNPANYQYAGHLMLGFVGLFRKKKKILPYGYVYDAVTKEPINKAIVRIYKGSKLLATTVSNVYGAFNANLEPGEYTLRIVSEGYIFPSGLIKGNTDSPLENIYRGGKFVVEEESQIKYSVPLDPVESSQLSNVKTVLKSNLMKLFTLLQQVLVVAGIFIALFMYIRNPNTLNLGIFMFYMPLLFIHMIFALSNKKHSFGVVRDVQGKILKGVTLGLREMEFEKLVGKRVTNDRGRYKFLVPGGIYKLEVLSSDYKIKAPGEKHLNFKGSVKKPLLINRNLVLEEKEDNEKSEYPPA